MIMYDHLGGGRRPGGRTRVPAILTYAAPPPENIPDLGAWCRPGGSGLGGHRCALCPRRSGGSRIARIQKTDSNGFKQQLPFFLNTQKKVCNFFDFFIFFFKKNLTHTGLEPAAFRLKA